MSKLSERLRRAQRGSTAAIGFGTTAAAATKVAPLLLLARLSPDDLPGATAAVASGADAIIFVGGLPSAEVRTALAEGPQIPWGLASRDALPPSMEEVKEASADFVIISAAKGRASWMNAEEGPGWGLEVSLDWADSLLRTVDSLPLDVVYLAEALTSDQLSVEQALRLRRVAQLAQRPLLVPLAGSWDSADLQALMATGASGVVSEGDAALKELRPLLDQLPPRGRRPGGHMEAALLRPPETPTSAPPNEEDDD